MLDYSEQIGFYFKWGDKFLRVLVIFEVELSFVPIVKKLPR